jgi:hypothetical protein
MSNPSGTWNVTVATPFGDQDLNLTIAVDGEKVRGTARRGSDSMTFTDGTYHDDKVVFEIALTAPITTDLKVTLKADGDTIAGTAKAGLLSFTATGTRAS